MTTTSDLVRQVRSQLQETNTTPVSDTVIIDALNRGKDYAVDILARYYFDPLIKPSDIIYSDANGEIDIPESSFEQRVKVVEYQWGQYFQKLRRLNVTEISPYMGVVSTTPAGFQIYGSKIRLYPTPNPSIGVRLWYMEEQEDLVPVQGRITQIFRYPDSTNAYITVDAIGSGIRADDPYNKYVNICDAQTGKVKATLEIQTISGTQISFKRTLTRNTVLNKTILDNIPDTVEADDYISTIAGTCVLPLRKPMSNFALQFAVTEIRRSLGFDTVAEEAALKRFEKQVEDTWSNREVTGRIQLVNPIWRNSRRRY